MPKIYYYFAFKNSEQEPARVAEPGLLTESGLQFEIIPRQGDNTLSVVGGDDLLVVSAHGSTARPSELVLCTQTGNQVMTANDLAAQIDTDGLKKTHQSILLITCEAGGISKLKQGALRNDQGGVSQSQIVIQRNKTDECLASILGKALGKRHYLSIIVGGFPGSFSPLSYSTGKKSTFWTTEQTRILAQLDHIQWFDARGVNTSKSA